MVLFPQNPNAASRKKGGESRHHELFRASLIPASKIALLRWLLLPYDSEIKEKLTQKINLKLCVGRMYGAATHEV